MKLVNFAPVLTFLPEVTILVYESCIIDWHLHALRPVARITYLEYHVIQVDLIWDPCGITHDRMRDRLKCDPPIGRYLPNLCAVRSVVDPRFAWVNIWSNRVPILIDR
jgi:hypothetical protein